MSDDPTARNLADYSIKAKVYRDGAVLCRFAGSNHVDIVHRAGAGCRRKNPILMELSAEEVEGLFRIEVMRDARTLPSRTLFCYCVVQSGVRPSRHDVLAARIRRAERALERAEERHMETLAVFEWEEAEGQAKGFYGQAFRDAQAAASDTLRRLDYARHRLDAVNNALSAPTLYDDEE
jgi:hypothetical protein